MDPYARRVVDNELDTLLPKLPAVMIDGPKGVGKTTTALQRAATIRRLDHPEQRSIATADPDAVLIGTPPVLVDEWHRAPSVWDAVKRAVDHNPTGGQFLLTGSTTITGPATHSGAGRIVALRMRPMTLPERGVCTPAVSLQSLLEGDTDVEGNCPLHLTDYTDQILATGLPGLRGFTGRSLRAALDGYADRIVDRELDEAGLRVRRPEAIRSWLRAYAAATSTTASWEAIRDAASPGTGNKPAKSTVTPYVEALSALRILDELEAWTPGNNRLNRLTLGAKHHLADPGLAARILGASRSQLLAGRPGAVTIPRDGTLLGALFESLATMTMRVFAQSAEARVFHLRTREGRHEVDLIVEQDDGRVFAFEVKLGGTVDEHDLRHIRWLSNTIGDQLIGGAVLTTGGQAYRRPADGIAVIPLGLLGP